MSGCGQISRKWRVTTRSLVSSTRWRCKKATRCSITEPLPPSKQPARVHPRRPSQRSAPSRPATTAGAAAPTLKSGCKAEESKLRGLLHPELAGLLDDDTQSCDPEALSNLALTPTEIAVLDRLVNDRPKARRRTLSHYLTKIGQARWLSCPRQRSTARRHRHVARAIAPDRHRTGSHCRSRNCG